MSIKALHPTALWSHFADLNAVPRPSKHEERVRQFVKGFGENLGLTTTVDEVGNVLILKPATKGMEDRPIVLLQGHIDMVHQKNADTDFDFNTEGIRMLINGDWVEADGTTLGADNGIGVAAIMAVLSDTGEIAHPPLEALFTIDEETGMTGAIGLKHGVLKAKYMLNLDTEDDRELTIGCAGGIDVTAHGTYQQEGSRTGGSGLRLTVRGLSGGHSGMDIIKGLGNANKLLVRLLLSAEDSGFSVSKIDGGGLRNAIPREAFSELIVNDVSVFEEAIASAKTQIEAEYAITDPSLEIVVEGIDAPAKVMSGVFQKQILRALQATPNGIWRMSPDVEGLVQTSNNLARVLITDGQYEVLCLTRSSVDTEKYDEVASIRSIYELIGGEISTDGTYPGWTPLPSSTLLTTMRDLYVKRFNEEPHVNACHAGLECGIIGEKNPGMEMISFGPNITGAHSPDERVQISSVQKFWGYFIEVLGAL